MPGWHQRDHRLQKNPIHWLLSASLGSPYLMYPGVTPAVTVRNQYAIAAHFGASSRLRNGTRPAQVVAFVQASHSASAATRNYVPGARTGKGSRRWLITLDGHPAVASIHGRRTACRNETGLGVECPLERGGGLE